MADHTARYNVVTSIAAAGEENLMTVINNVQLYDMFGVDPRNEAVALKFEEVLAGAPRNMRQGRDRYTVGIVGRLVAAGYTVKPNWFVQNKATHRVDLDTGRYTVSQSGIVSKCLKNTGVSLQSHCIKMKYVQCAPWKVKDKQTGGDMLIVAYQQGPHDDNMYVITTVGNRVFSTDGRQL